MIKKGIVFFVEGATECEFYNKMLKFFHSKYGEFKFNKVEVRNIKGITNFSERVIRKFEKNFVSTFPEYEFTVVLAYDTDVFDYAEAPKIKWKDVENNLKRVGAKKVIHIKANKSIEDWFLNDLDGVKKYLKVSKTVKVKGSSGQEKIKKLFRLANKTYIKGEKCEGFIETLNMEKILMELPKELEPIYKVFEYK